MRATRSRSLEGGGVGSVINQAIVVGDCRGWSEMLLYYGAKPLWVEGIKGETGRDKVLFSFQQGWTANAGSPMFLLSYSRDRFLAYCRLLALLWKLYWLKYLPSVLYFLIPFVNLVHISHTSSTSCISCTYILYISYISYIHLVHLPFPSSYTPAKTCEKRRN